MSTNIRVHLYVDTQAGATADVLLRIGEGKIPIISAVDCIWIPPGGGNVTDTLNELKAAVRRLVAIVGHQSREARQRVASLLVYMAVEVRIRTLDQLFEIEILP